MMTLAERAIATDKVITKFREKPFDWRHASTCIHLARAQIVAMGGKVPPIPRFQSPLAARRSLKKLGHTSVLELLDAVLPGQRIAPAAMIVGDLGILPGEDGLDAVVIAAGHKVIGWHGSDLSRLQVIEVSRGDLIAAWRL
ncbi:MAG TPA: hypothetical protein VF637_15755 [Sphingomicrobium sp.]|jgi:hypothetical protein